MPYKNPNLPENIEKARLARRKHYQKNKEQYKKNNRLKKKRMYEYIWEIKNTTCMDCGIKYPSYVMDFDHRNQEKKNGSMNQVINRGSWKKLKEEIDKCDVVCANCHRERTAKQLGYRDVG